MQNTQEISAVEILSFEVTKEILMLDMSVTLSISSTKGGEQTAPSVAEVLKSLSFAPKEEKESSSKDEEEKVAAGDSTVVNPWTVESDGAIDYLR